MTEKLETNSIFSHYRIVSQIGAGGMGEVYLAEDTRLGRRVALKVLPEGIAGNRDRRLRFEREAQAALARASRGVLSLRQDRPKAAKPRWV